MSFQGFWGNINKKLGFNFIVLSQFQLLTFKWTKIILECTFLNHMITHLCIKRAFMEYHLLQVDWWKEKYAGLIAVQIMALFQARFSLEQTMKPNYLKYKGDFAVLQGKSLESQWNYSFCRKMDTFLLPPPKKSRILKVVSNERAPQIAWNLMLIIIIIKKIINK